MITFILVWLIKCIFIFHFFSYCTVCFVSVQKFALHLGFLISWSFGIGSLKECIGMVINTDFHFKNLDQNIVLLFIN